MAETMYRQFDLTGDDGGRLTCWIEDDARLTEGTRMTLKQTGDEVWTVAKRYESLSSHDALHRRWKVGGLK